MTKRIDLNQERPESVMCNLKRRMPRITLWSTVLKAEEVGLLL